MTIDSWKITNSKESFSENKVIKSKISMKNIFIPSNIKKRKFTKEIVDTIKFASIKKFMNIKDGNEAYLGAYSELEFFAYRFLKTHGFYPDLFKICHVKSIKFLTEFFKYADIPIDSYYKSYESNYEKVSLNLIMFCIETGRDDKLYVFMDMNEVSFFYNKKYEKQKENPLHILISLFKNYIEPKVVKNKIYVVYKGDNGFDKTGFNVKKINVNLEENYNDDFLEISKEIIIGLNNKKKTNLVILSGEPGTGKTTYIRYLTSKIKKNIIFIAPDMVNYITDPSFIPFLIKNNDAVLIIEDAEPALQSRKNDNRTGAVSNVLNLTDGLLSDCLNISIIATFNTTEKRIDNALLRKGRLLKSYNFEKLCVEKSQNLLNKLKTKVKVTESMTLADIYFYSKEDNNLGIPKKKKIGF